MQYASLIGQLSEKLNRVVNYHFFVPSPKMSFPGIEDFLKKYQARAKDSGVDPLGFYQPPFAYAAMQILEQAIKGLKDKGIILIAAAGNAGPKSPPLFPGADANVIAVSATDVDDKTYKNANRGKQIAIAAPGVDILVPAPAGGYQLTTGTSVAAAHISGVVALMLERNPRLTPNDVRNILAATAKKLPNSRNDVGAGLVDPVQALSKSGPRSAAAR